MNNCTLLTGKKVRLRAPEPSDIELLYKWENDPAIWEVSNTLAPFSRFQIEEYVLNARQDLLAARQLRMMIDLIENHGIETTIGTVDMFDYDPLNSRAGVGILICDPYRGQGFAGDAMKTLIKYAFSHLYLHQLYCNISENNSESLRLFESLGFVRCGIRRDWIRRGAGWEHELTLQLVNHHE